MFVPLFINRNNDDDDYGVSLSDISVKGLIICFLCISHLLQMVVALSRLQCNYPPYKDIYEFLYWLLVPVTPWFLWVCQNIYSSVHTMFINALNLI